MQNYVLCLVSGQVYLGVKFKRDWTKKKTGQTSWHKTEHSPYDTAAICAILNMAYSNLLSVSDPIANAVIQSYMVYGLQGYWYFCWWGSHKPSKSKTEDPWYDYGKWHGQAVS